MEVAALDLPCTIQRDTGRIGTYDQVHLNNLRLQTVQKSRMNSVTLI